MIELAKRMAKMKKSKLKMCANNLDNKENLVASLQYILKGLKARD